MYNVCPVYIFQALGGLCHHFVMLCEFEYWVCGESWHAIKDLQPTAPVLKAGHLVSCSSLCMLCVVCLVCIVWFVEVRFLGLFLFFLLLLS